MPQASISTHLHLLFQDPVASEGLTYSLLFKNEFFPIRNSINLCDGDYWNTSEAWRNTHLMLRRNRYQRLPIEVSDAAQKITKCHSANFELPFAFHLFMIMTFSVRVLFATTLIYFQYDHPHMHNLLQPRYHIRMTRNHSKLPLSSQETTTACYYYRVNQSIYLATNIL